MKGLSPSQLDEIARPHSFRTIRFNQLSARRVDEIEEFGDSCSMGRGVSSFRYVNFLGWVLELGTDNECALLEGLDLSLGITLTCGVLARVIDVHRNGFKETHDGGYIHKK